MKRYLFWNTGRGGAMGGLAVVLPVAAAAAIDMTGASPALKAGAFLVLLGGAIGLSFRLDARRGRDRPTPPPSRPDSVPNCRLGWAALAICAVWWVRACGEAWDAEALRLSAAHCLVHLLPFTLVTLAAGFLVLVRVRGSRGEVRGAWMGWVAVLSALLVNLLLVLGAIGEDGPSAGGP